MFAKPFGGVSNKLFNVSAKNFAVNEKALKIRLRSVNSIAKITKAMKMVSSSKMKGDMVRLQNGRDFGHKGFEKIFITDETMQKKIETEAGNRILYVPFTSDKGLCGGINSGIVKEIKNTLLRAPNRSQCGIFVVGDKGNTALARPFSDIMISGVHDIQNPINYFTASGIASQIEKLSENYDKIIFIYNSYKSAISTEITYKELIPRRKFIEYMYLGKRYFIKYPDKNTANPALYDLYLGSNVYNALLNNFASEQSARMNAMENASKNAKEIGEKLLLQYNKARQARITMELVEIISGASAV
jgi:F-type H+-transporting ATPase subunit gamma